MARKWNGNWHALLSNYSGTNRLRARLQNKPERQEAKREIEEQIDDDDG